MTKGTAVTFRAPKGFSTYPLTVSLRQGAWQLITEAVKAEVNAFLAARADQTAAEGRSDWPGIATCSGASTDRDRCGAPSQPKFRIGLRGNQ